MRYAHSQEVIRIEMQNKTHKSYFSDQIVARTIACD